MECFTNPELVDMHLDYRLTERNAQATERLHRERYPLRDATDCRMFANFYHNLCELCSIHIEDGPPIPTGNTFCFKHGTKCVGCRSNYTRAYGDGPHHFESWPSDDDTLAATTSLNFDNTPTGGDMTRSSSSARRVFSGSRLELMTRQPRVHDLDHYTTTKPWVTIVQALGH
ncbi:hypothetical protein TNCV_5124411 [Trichonephila clavipes]|nr:hypothetical protein TNCV_5124411 [Trichonephila clavipes]